MVNASSRRMLLKDDGMGFSFHETIIKTNQNTHSLPKSSESCLLCCWNWKIEDLKTGVVHEIYDGVMYALNNHDEHNLYGGSEDMRFICVFNPPIKGTENHDEIWRLSAC